MDISNDEFSKFYSKLVAHAEKPVIRIYFSPKDHPLKYVARLWDADNPSFVVVTTDTLEEIRTFVPQDMSSVGRQKGDDPYIVETWFRKEIL